MKKNNCHFFNLDRVQECSNFDKEKIQNFKIFESYNKSEIIEKELINNYFIFVLKGSCTLSYNDSNTIDMTKSDFALTPSKTKIIITIMQHSRIAILQFSPQECICNRIYLDGYKQIAKSINFKFKPLKIKPDIALLLTQLENYINARMCCGRLFEIKQEEFFFCLRSLYTKSEVANLLYPILECDNNFKEFVETNFERVQTISQLIQLSAMCKTYFYERFKNEFGMTAKQWMLKQKVKMIERKFSEPGVRINDVVNEYNFPSSEYLHRFCRKYIGLTPSELIKRNNADNKALMSSINILEKKP